jgi:sec-independent protein translocase protein TatB|tara:strand:- start:959 stop:1237 length:279 start_codon:yes stop_codon:yes gene_type:complete
MFDIGFMEILLIAAVSLVVMGPKRLPHAVRQVSLWIGRIKQAFSTARQQLENEVGMDDIKRQLHNEKIMQDLSTPEAEKQNVENNGPENLSK